MEALSKDLWVFIETDEEGKARNVGLELLNPGRRLADAQGGVLVAVVIGYKTEAAVKEAAAYGADKIIVVDGEEYQHYTTDAYADAMYALVTKYGPTTMMIGATNEGRDMGPRLSCRLRTGLTADCTAVDYDEETGNIAWTRPTFGGNLLATIMCPDHRPQMATVREGVKWLPEKQLDVFFVTLNKADKDYSPTTMYKDYSINENGVPCCPHAPSLPMKPEGSKSNLRSGIPTFKFVCPKMKWVYDKTTRKAHRQCFCENPCTSSKCGRMVYIYPEKNLRAYPVTIRGTEEWDDTYKIRTVVERDINHIKDNLCLAGRRTQNEKTLHADLILAGITQLITVVLADKINHHEYIRSIKPLIA